MAYTVASRARRASLGLTLCLGIAVSAQACSSQPDARSQEDMSRTEQGLAEGQLSKRAWIKKAAEVLRNGEGIGPDDNMDELMVLSEDAILDRFMADPRFGDTMLAFNLYYLSRPAEQLKEPSASDPTRSVYSPSVYAMPQAISGARAMVSGGDYFNIYSAAQPLFIAPMRPATEPFPPDPSVDARTAHFNRIREAIAQLRATAASSAPDAKASACSSIGFESRYGFMITRYLDEAGFDRLVAQAVRESWIAPLAEGDCVDANVTAAQLVTKLDALRDGLEAVMTQAASLPTTANNVGEIATLSVNVPGLAPLSPQTPFTQPGFWETALNSSTNVNRRRASYIWKTYFCDDLTPLAVPSPDGGHSEGKHGSAPECAACHYKLDPVAGLFRYNGKRGRNYEGRTSFLFDDDTALSGPTYEAYLDNWRKDGNWVVGVNKAPNTLHDSWRPAENKLSDMWGFMKRAPEVRSCLVRRMAEYFLGANQVYDGTWLADVKADLKPGTGSSAKVKAIIRKLITSRTFSTSDPEHGKCYDCVGGQCTEGPDKLPCEINSIVQTRCVNCHSEINQPAHLRVKLTGLVQLADGTYGFDHEDPNGNKLTRNQSFRRIMKYITTGDPEAPGTRTMPPGGMDAGEKTILYKWLERNSIE
ncbi:hypothetical protein LZC95_48180 [Pendulispora brunnea]|uniref:Uncharacterized protein n=1 Tax=Pendulispora brunnea TaxID=2905690 RepID=A0ABZ2K688_9BACT